MRRRLEEYFEFASLGATWRTEILAGFTTFVTMAYIIVVNPAILSDAGMPPAAVAAATCISAATGSILMGALARYPIALAPGMGLNAYFTYTVVKGMGVPWQTALGAVFVSGLIFLALTLAGVRRLIVDAIPRQLYAAVAAGVGLFIAFIGLRNSGIIVPDRATTVALGNLRDPHTALSLFGLLLIAGLQARGVRASMLMGILGATVAGGLAGLVTWQPRPYSLSELSATAFRLDLPAVLRLGLAEIVFVFLFVDLFDNIGTLVAVGKKAGLLDSGNRIPRIQRILLADSIATLAGALAGTSTVVSYIESSAGVSVGGRTGIPAILTGLLFLAALFLSPLAAAVPNAATAPALIVVGAMMMSASAEIDWADYTAAIPAFLTMTVIPLSFSIANGLAFGFTAYTLLKIFSGRWKQVNLFVYFLTTLFIVRFFYLAKG